MTRLRFNYNAGKLSEDLSSNGVSPQNENVDLADELYDRLDVVFKVVWESQSRAEPVIDTSDIPNEISKSDVESALVDMQNSGIL